MTPRRSIAILVFAPLLLAMAAGQMADVGAFRRILEDYHVFGGAEPAVAVAVPALELLVGVALLARRRLPGVAVRGAAVGGLVVAAFWTALATQAFARGLMLQNCGCFGVYLGQSLRWWILLEDAEFLLLAVLSARAAGLRRRGLGGLPRHERRIADATVLEGVSRGGEQLQRPVDG